jgi:hypothetical protein
VDSWFSRSSSARTPANSTTYESYAQDTAPRNGCRTFVAGNADEDSSTISPGVNVAEEPCSSPLEIDASGDNVIVPQGRIATGGGATNSGSGAAITSEGIDDSGRCEREKA